VKVAAPLPLRLTSVVLVATSCAGEPSQGLDSTPPASSLPEPVPEAELIVVDSWREDAAVDPVPEHRPSGAICSPSGWGEEGSSLEVDTGLCPYAVLTQPAGADLQPGDVVEVVLWHKDLVADGPAEAHVLLTVGEVVVYERTVPIPADPTAYTEQVTIDGTAAAGDPVVLHLHNHGANTWNVLSLTRLASP